MIYLFILLLILVIGSHIVLYRMLVKMITYQNFKINVLYRAVGNRPVNIDEDTSTELYYLKNKFSWAIDEEIDNSGRYLEILNSIMVDQKYFRIESHPFYNLFSAKLAEEYYQKKRKNQTEK